MRSHGLETGLPAVFGETVLGSPRSFPMRLWNHAEYSSEKGKVARLVDPPERMVGEPVVEEISTERRVFSSHTVAKMTWSVAQPQGKAEA